MKPSPRHGLRTLALALVLGTVAVGAYLRSPSAWRHTCTLARDHLPGLLGMQVSIGSCEVDPLSATLSLRQLVLTPHGAQSPLLSVDVAHVGIDSIGPFGIDLSRVELERPRLDLDLRTPPGAPKKPSDPDEPFCPVELLDQVDIHKLALRGGEVKLWLPGGERLALEGVEVGWKSRRGALDTQLQVLRGTFEAKGMRPLPLSNLAVTARLDPDDEELELTRGEVAVDDATLNLTGRIEALCEPRLALDAQLFVPLTAVARYLPLPRPVGGHVWAHLSLGGTPDAPNAVMQLQGSRVVLGEQVPGDFSAHLNLSGALLQLTELRTQAGDGHVVVRGQMALGPKLPLQLSFETERASFGAIMARAGVPGSWVDFPATAKGSFKGRLLPRVDLEGEVHLTTERFSLTSRGYDAPAEPDDVILTYEGGRVDTKVRLHPDRIEFKGARVASRNSVAKAETTLHFDPVKGLDIQGELEAVDLGDFGHIAGLEWAGKGTGTFHVHGPYADVQVQGTASLKDFVFWDFGVGTAQGNVSFVKDTLAFTGVNAQKGKSAYSGEASLRWPAEGEMHSRATVRMPDGRVEDVVEILAGLHPNIARLRGAFTGRAQATVRIDSPASAFAGDVQLRLQDVDFFGRRLGSGTSSIRFEDGERMVLGRTVLSGPAGRTFAQGAYDWDGALDFKFGGEELSLSEWYGAEEAAELGLSGLLTLSGTWRGDVASPVASAYLTSPRIQLGGRDLGRTHLEARLDGEKLDLWGKPFGSGTANFRLTYAAPYPYEGTLTVAIPELRTLLPRAAQAQGVSGSVRGTLGVVGQLEDARTVRAKARIEELTLSRGDFRGRNAAPVELTYGGGKLEVQAFSFRGPNTELQAAGLISRDALDVSAHGTFDMRMVESFAPALERSAGRVELTASLGGTPARPKLIGTAEIHDARFSIQDGAWNLRGVGGRVEFSEARVLISDAHGTLNEGRMALRGDVRLLRGEVDRVEVGLQLDEVTARLVDDLPAVVSGELLLQGKPDRLSLGGDLDIHKLRYDQPLVIEAFIADLAKRNAAYYGTGEKPREWLTLDVKLRSSGDVRVDNNLAKAKLLGAVRLTGTNLRPGFLGTVEAAPGSQLYFRGNQFQISQALVELKDKHGLEAVFDVHAQTQVREYLIQLHAFGRATQPQLVFSSEPALPEGDILSLLTLGVTSRDKSNTAGTGAGLAAEALFSASGLDREVQKFLPKGPVLRDLQFHIATTYNDVTGFVEPTAQLESKLLTERLKLGMAQPVSGRGTRAQAEYRFHDRLSAQAQWDNQNTDSAFGNLGLDLKLRWEVE